MPNTPCTAWHERVEIRNFAKALYGRPARDKASLAPPIEEYLIMHDTEIYPQRGRIEVICGSMFSGKTEELIRRIRRARIARQRVEIFKPEIDVRYSESEVVSHDGDAIVSTPVASSQAILLLASEADVVGIDEAQFFDSGIVDVCNALANQGKRVVVAGLDMDFKGTPFGPMPALCAIAEDVTKVHAEIWRTSVTALWKATAR